MVDISRRGLLVGGGAMALAIGSGGVPGLPGSPGLGVASAEAGSSTLLPGEVLRGGERLISASGQYELVMQGDGNLVEYSLGRAIWSTGTKDSGADRAVLQGDGNFVVYAGGTAVWHSHTNDTAVDRLVVQNDGNVVAYEGTTARWNNGGHADRIVPGNVLRPGMYIASGGRRFRAILQGDGNFVVYDHGTALWSSRTNGDGVDRVVLQGDGNLVAYDGGTARWHSHTSGEDSDRLIMQGDGNLVLYAGSSAVWSSGTKVGGSSGGRAPYTGYPYTTASPNQMDPWLFNYRNCTSYCAWWLNASGASFSNYMAGPNGRSGQFGNAQDWNDNAIAIGFPVNGTPKVGSIACWESGHVAIVTKVNTDGSVAVAEYNVPANSFAYSTRSAVRANSYIHIPLP